MFQGTSSINLDAKGRMLIPARHRDALLMQCEGRITLCRHPHGCLLFFPRPVWETMRQRIVSWTMEAKWWQRILLGSAVDVEIDSAGRILISPELRKAASLSKEVLMLGMGTHFEIWDAKHFQESEALAMQQDMPNVLKDLSL